MAPLAASRRAAAGAALAAVFLLAFAAPPAAAVTGTTCFEQDVTLVPNDPRGGCNSIQIAAATLFADSTGNATVTFAALSGSTPASPPLSNGYYTFNAGTKYTFTVAGAATCSANITVNPCTPVCKDVHAEVDAAVKPSCLVSVGALTGAPDLELFDLTTIGANAISANITPPNAFAPASYGVGVFTVTAKVKYPGMTSPASNACRIKVVDITAVAAPTALNTCFYRNDTSNRACVPLSQVAKPAAASCGSGARHRVIATKCDPRRVGGGTRGARVCVTENKPATSRDPVPRTAVCVARNRIGSKRLLQLELGVADVNNAVLGDNRLAASITIYPRKRAVPADLQATCIPVTKKF